MKGNFVTKARKKADFLYHHQTSTTMRFSDKTLYFPRITLAIKSTQRICTRVCETIQNGMLEWFLSSFFFLVVGVVQKFFFSWTSTKANGRKVYLVRKKREKGYYSKYVHNGWEVDWVIERDMTKSLSNPKRFTFFSGYFSWRILEFFFSTCLSAKCFKYFVVRMCLVSVVVMFKHDQHCDLEWLKCVLDWSMDS